MSLAKRYPWFSQPPINTKLDWTNPLTFGLRATIQPRLGKLCINNVTGSKLVNDTHGISQISEKVNYRSPLAAGNVASASYVIPSGISGYTTQSDCTILAIVEGTGDTDIVHMVELMDNGLSGFVSLAICAGDGTNSRWIGRIRLGGVSYTFGSSTETAMTAGKTDVICVVHRRDVGQTLYVNGVKSSAGLSQSGNFDYTPDSATLGRTANKYAGLALFYSRALSDQQVFSLSTNPWQIFQP